MVSTGAGRDFGDVLRSVITSMPKSLVIIDFTRHRWPVHLTTGHIFPQEKTQGDGGARGWERRGSVKSVDKALTRVVCRGRHAACWREVRNVRFDVEAGW